VPNHTLGKLTCVILAGGRGTRLGSAFDFIPKPLVRVGPYPIILHIISIYFRAGVNQFLVCTGFKSKEIESYFEEISVGKSGDTFLLQTEMFPKLFSKANTSNSDVKISVRLLSTGLESTTAGRVKQALEHIDTDQFLCTYGDGLAKIDISDVFDVHNRNSFEVTMAAFHPPSRFGEVTINETGRVLSFREKQLSSVLVNGGFFVMESRVKYQINPNLSLEEGLLTSCANNGTLGAFVSKDFWQMMDTPREVEILNRLYLMSEVPWLEL
jgi:glucose-1-phosphate cytidylyltransferase